MGFLHPKENINFFLLMAIGMVAGISYLYLFPTQPAFFSATELEMYNYTHSGILVIKPLLTANAYKKGGFYDYYQGNCNESCLTIDIDQNIDYQYDSSLRAIKRFEKLGATMADDYTLNPRDMVAYDKIVLLHNEYVTQEFFDAIIRHPNVVYMYPNALYGKVSVQDGKMTLIQGHGYNGKDNGFDWKYDNTNPYEGDKTCKNFEWKRIYNGIQLNCYPENFLMNNTWIFGDVKFHSAK